MNLYQSLLRPLLFRLDPETAHHWTVEACRYAGCVPLVPRAMRTVLSHPAPELCCEVAGMQFDNPVGLAAGWDKSGRALRMIDHLGFGFAEIGSVSARPSAGNPKPRLFRLPDERAIVVNYGLPNDGAEIVAARMAKHHSRAPLGVNIVKTNDGPNAAECDADTIIADYSRSLELLHQYASYVTLNLSCPNAKGGRDHFAVRGAISRLLQQLAQTQVGCPVFLKVAPDPAPKFLDRLLEESAPWDFVRGFIFNLPSGKPETLCFASKRSNWQSMPGAVAGKPVQKLIDQCIAELYARMPRGRFVIIGAGGIFSAQDAYQKILAGASLVQIYSGMVYEGPCVVRRINCGLAERLRQDGFRNVSEAVGTAAAK